jgi:threonyl-tRNA synthetase
LKEEDPSSANGPATSTAAGRKAYPFPDGLGPNDELDRQREASQAAKANPFPDGHIAPHPGFQDHTESDSGNKGQGEVCYLLMNPVYEKDYLESVQPYHIPPVTVRQKVGFYAVQAMRRTFDLATGYKQHGMTEAKMLQRILFLETVAGVPGMVAGMLRHMRSLRAMKRDHGWIHTLLEESENERLHLLTFLQLREPGPLFRLMVLLGQGVFFNTYMAAYLLSPKTCHYFIGYLEEEAVKTYTHAIHTIDAGKLPEWNSLPVPKIAKDYWKLADDATMRDLLLNVRADEACHSHVNHTFGSLEPDADNPFAVGNHTVPQYHKQAVENGQPVPTYGKEQ